ncbi:MAG: ribosome small subunit-dependent GTPase A [Chitinivibrionales bacterium]|nr:ribosome small subunit-dependent GTPase A [Chitinivibrionales bacterium]
MALRGRIVSQQKNLYLVDTEEGIVEARLRGTLKRKRDKPWVGDIVTLELIDRAPLRGIIAETAERRNLLRRPTIANVDHVLFLVTLVEPKVEPETVDRFLVCAEELELESTLVFNKTDLLDSSEQASLEEYMAIYRRVGYRCIAASAALGDGIDAVVEACRGKVSTMAGPSGVGKSTLLNRLAPGRELKTAEVSARTARGVHTTTTTALFSLGDNTYVADTPGFAVIDLPDIDPRDVALCMPELREHVGICRFNDCMHREEPGCAVRELVTKGEIPRSRYEHYLRFCAELERRDQLNPTARNQ